MRSHRLLAALLTVGVVVLAHGAANAVMIARYSFDAGNAADLSGNVNNGVVGSNVSFPSDTIFGNGLSASTGSGGGTTRIITVPTSLTLESINSQLTISFWVRGDAAGNPNWVRLFQHANEGGGTQGWLINRNSNTSDVNMRVDTLGVGGQFNQNIAVGGTVVLNNVWHHMMYTLNNGIYREYVDGLLSTSGTYNHGNGVYNTRPFVMFGNAGGGDPYAGLLDDVALWDDAKGQGYAATMNAVARWYGYDLDVSGVEAVASLSTLGAVAYAGDQGWQYVNSFPAANDASTLTAGKYYTGVDGTRYIIFSGNSPNFVGVQNVPEPATLALLGLGLAALARRRRRS